WNEARGALLVFGGRTSVQGVQDSWEWTGTWKQLDLDFAPAPRGLHGMASSRDGVVLFGGRSGNAGSTSTVLSDTWELRSESSVRPDVCHDRDGDNDQKVGCADPDCAADCTACGNGVPDPRETCRTCPEDFTSCASRCGDLVCDAGE